MVRFLALTALATSISPAFTADPPKKSIDPTAFEARFADGSVVQLHVLEPTLAIATKYGKLSIPLADVRRVEFGFRYPEGMQAKVDAVVEDFGSREFQAREKASQNVLAFGEFALPSVKQAMKHSSPEVVRRAQEALRKLEQTLSKEVLELRDYDMVQTADGPIRGTIETAGFKAKTKYFGDATLKLADLRLLRPMGRGAVSVALDASKFAMPGYAAWMDSGVEVATDGILDFTVSGTIDQMPSTPGQMTSGPAGTSNFVTGPNGERTTLVQPGGRGGGFGGPGGGPGAAQRIGGARSGAVYGKIGESGTAFLIGEAYKMKPCTSGRLFLIIAPSNQSNENSSGEYSVRVKAGG